ncbi:MAG: hypothetical protein EOO11_02100 [Chitinophagaceae bacterium]|nr:MAG: hypothetical protein EOO11_02100 [Chitinophagaceae bacterium]
MNYRNNAIAQGLFRLCFLPLLALMGTSCSAQENNEKPEKEKAGKLPPAPYVVAEKKGTLEDYATQYKMDIGTLRELNPRLLKRVKAKDTVFFAAMASTMPRQEVPQGFSERAIGKGGLFRQVNFKGKQYFLCEVNPKQYRIEAFNRTEDERSTHSFASVRRIRNNDLVFAVNGGMFEPDGRPVGLLISGGRTVSELNNRKEGHGNYYELQPNGVFVIDSSDKAQVVTGDQFPGLKVRPRVATQSGPMLVVGNTINANFRPNSPNVKVRNGVGVNKAGNVVFVISEDLVTFYEFAELFRDELHCNDALYLDGVVSQYYAPELQGQPRQLVPLGVILTVSKRGREGGNQAQEPREDPKQKVPKKAEKPVIR